METQRFQNLSVIELERSFIWKLEEQIPNEKESILKQMKELLYELDPSKEAYIRYLLYLDTHGYSDEAWGNGLYIFGMLPDSGLMEEESKIRRRFFLNLEKVSDPLADFSITPVDRVVALLCRKALCKRIFWRSLTVTRQSLTVRLCLKKSTTIIRNSTMQKCRG